MPGTGEEAQKSPVTGCLMPVEVMRISDYSGPLHSLVGRFFGRVERRTFYSPHYKRGAMLCSLTALGKLRLYGENYIDPGTYAALAFSTGIDQWQNNNPAFGRGGPAFVHRFGANLAAQASSDFLSGVFYPALFRLDPRYYRLVHASAKRRLLHALGHSVIAHDDNGHRRFNYSEWLGVSSAVVVNNVFHPGSLHGFVPATQRGLIVIATDSAFDVLREFWPEVARKFKLPVRPPQYGARRP